MANSLPEEVVTCLQNARFVSRLLHQHGLVDKGAPRMLVTAALLSSILLVSHVLISILSYFDFAPSLSLSFLPILMDDNSFILQRARTTFPMSP